MRKVHYEIEFGNEEHDLALAVINGFAVELDDPDGKPMVMPVIAMSSDAIAWGPLGIDTSGKFGLVLDLEPLTIGCLKEITPLQLGYSLFDPNAREQITYAMINAMAWIKDVETRGLNRYNNREILGFFEMIQETFLRNVAKHLARDYGL